MDEEMSEIQIKRSVMINKPADFKTPLNSFDPQVERRHSHYRDSIFDEFLKRQKYGQPSPPKIQECQMA